MLDELIHLICLTIEYLKGLTYILKVLKSKLLLKSGKCGNCNFFCHFSLQGYLNEMPVGHIAAHSNDGHDKISLMDSYKIFEHLNNVVK